MPRALPNTPCEQNFTMDACGSYLTFDLLLKIWGLYGTSTDSKPEIDWKPVILISHPIHKAGMNGQMTQIQLDKDKLGVLKRFWETVTWHVDSTAPKDQMIVVLGPIGVEIKNLWA